VAEVQLAGEELATIGESHAEINHDDDDATSGDVTVLAIGGNEVVGVHSSAPNEGDTDEDEAGLALLCEESGNSSTESSSSAQTQLAFVCVGGEQTLPQEDCSGVVGAQASSSQSSITKDKRNGNETADASTDLADVCIRPEGEVAGTCSGLGVTVVHSESHSEISDTDGNSDTRDETGSTESSSYLLGVDLAGEQTLVISDPVAIAIPPDCPEEGSLLCLFLNQGTAFEIVGSAGSRQEAIHIDVLKAVGQIPGASLVLGHLGVSETLVQGQLGNQCPPGTIGTPPNCIKGGDECPEAFVLVDEECVRGEVGLRGGPRGGPPTLAFTGAGALPLLPLSLILGVGGASILAWDRRRGDTR
jgi:hypothetical protein